MGADRVAASLLRIAAEDLAGSGDEARTDSVNRVFPLEGGRFALRVLSALT